MTEPAICKNKKGRKPLYCLRHWVGSMHHIIPFFCAKNAHHFISTSVCACQFASWTEYINLGQGSQFCNMPFLFRFLLLVFLCNIVSQLKCICSISALVVNRMPYWEVPFSCLLSCTESRCLQLSHVVFGWSWPLTSTHVWIVKA